MIKEETRKKISQQLKGISKSEETKNKIKNSKKKQFSHLYTLSDFEVNNLIYDYTINHMTIKQLMDKYKLTKVVATNYLKNNNVKIRDNSESHRLNLTQEQINNIIEYYNNGHTLSEVARLTNIKRGTVYNIITNIQKCRATKSYLVGKKCSNETKKKISLANKGHKVDIEKQISTKRKNNSFNTSKPEQKLFNELQNKYGEKNVIFQYKDSKRYPYYCDFYVISEDLFIELNAHWTHGGKPFDKNDIECQNKLKIWTEKSKNSKFYRQAIYIWTDLDVRKLQCAKEHNLNYITIY